MKLAEQLRNRFTGQTRSQSYHVPDKVFIQEDGSHYEWSEDQPAMLDKFYNLFNGYYGMQNFIELFYCLPEVFAPVHEIASRVADATWELKKEWNDEVDYNNADFNRLFTQPNPLQDHKTLVYWSVVYEILTGRQFWFQNSPTFLTDLDKMTSTLAWWNLEAQKVYVEHRKTDPYISTEVSDFIQSYSIPKQDGGKRFFDVENVMPIFNVDMTKAFDFNKCKALILGAEKAIRNLIPVYEARGIIYIKRGIMGLLVSRKQDDSGMQSLSKRERLQLSKDMSGSYGVTGGKEPYAMTGMPVDFIKTSMSLQEMMPFDETAADALAIYSTLRIPRHLAPTKDQSTFSNAAADMKAFYSDVIIPWGKKYALIWTNGFKTKSIRRYIYANYNHVDCLQENKKEKSDVDKTNAETFTMLYEKGVITKNERNAALGYASVPEGDTYVTDIQNRDPIATKLPNESIKMLQSILTSGTISEESRKNILVILFGINPADADKMVKQNEQNINTPPETGKPPVNGAGN